MFIENINYTNKLRHTHSLTFALKKVGNLGIPDALIISKY